MSVGDEGAPERFRQVAWKKAGDVARSLAASAKDNETKTAPTGGRGTEQRPAHDLGRTARKDPTPAVCPKAPAAGRYRIGRRLLH